MGHADGQSPLLGLASSSGRTTTSSTTTSRASPSTGSPRCAALDPFFAERGIRARTYRGLLWDWFVRNRTPHTDWHASAPLPPVESRSAGSAA